MSSRDPVGFWLGRVASGSRKTYDAGLKGFLRWLGHVVDPLGYDKFHLDKEYVRKQYLIAEKYLNIFSQPQSTGKEEQERIRKLERRIDTMTNTLSGIAGALEKIGIRWLESKDGGMLEFEKGQQYVVPNKDESTS